MVQVAQLFTAPEGLLALTNRVSRDDELVRGQGPGFTWETRTAPAHGGYWVETTLTTERDLTFNPALVLWLGALDNLNDRQAHTWRQTLLRAPTTNQQGLGGNDLPAGYLYDHDQRTETIFYVPPDSLTWAPHRFYELAIREVMEYRPKARYGFGLVPTSIDPTFPFSPGTHHFRFWVQQNVYEPDGRRMISTWTAQRHLIQAIAPLLDTQPTLTPDAPDWETMARGTLTDLDHEACWVSAGGKTGLRAYVRGSSSVGRDEQKDIELMTQLDVLIPLLHWRNETGEKGADAIIERLLEAVRAFQIIEPHRYLPNHYPYRPTHTFMDTWYFYENALIKLPWVAHLTGDMSLRQTFLTALEGGRELAQRTHYLLPLFADAAGWETRGSLLNASVSGMYAAGCILAWQMTRDKTHLEEARKALEAIHALPPHLLTHEPQQLSFAAAAAVWLFKEGRDVDMGIAAVDFVDLSLRMGYWGQDPSVPYYDARGMFQACASLCYPAYKENVEVIWPWSELLSGSPFHLELTHLTGVPDHELNWHLRLMAAFANLQRCHNYAFFDPFLPESMRRGPCPHIPYEDLATSEFTHTAKLGKELYGAGEVFWSPLLFARPGFLTDVPPEVLTFSLNVPCLRLTPERDESRRWLVYNPRPTPVVIRSLGGDFEAEPNGYQIVKGP
ncbi:MAG: hypothetical protein IPK19_17040 [Chloroflexi bacterium]|nr:hypothetical protein [Chloroflexota bacterium]